MQAELLVSLLILSFPALASAEATDICITGKVHACYLSHPVAAPDDKKSIFSITDANAGFYVLAPTNAIHAVGDIVAVSGKLEFINYIGHTVIMPCQMTTLRHEAPDSAVTVGLREIRDGAWLFRSVTTSGLAIEAFHDELDNRWSWLLISDNETTVPLAVQGENIEQTKLDSLIGQTITATGLCAPSTGRRRFICPIVRIADFNDIRTSGGNLADDFNVPRLKPATSVKSLNRYHLCGFVLAVWNERRLFVQPDNGKAIEIKLRPGAILPHVGDFIDVSGFAKTDIFNVSLTQAIWRPQPTTSPFRPHCTDVSPRDLIVGTIDKQRIETDFHGKLIRITGVTTASPKDLPENPYVHLNCDGHIISLDVSALRDSIGAIEPGSTVSATGVCQLELDTANQASALPRVKGFSMIIRCPDDIVVLRAPPWWSAGKLLLVIGILLVLLLAIVLWNISLRIIAERRGRELFRENVARISADLKTEERTRLAVDLHDSLAQMLTGVSFLVDAGDFENVSKSLKSCRDELRNCLWDLRNQTLEQKDMDEAIRRTLKPHIGTAKLVVRFNVPRENLSDLTAHSVLMIIRELVTNAVRHGHARTIRVAGGLDDDKLILSVRDDGSGFDPNNHPGLAEGHFGLQGISERVKRCDGTIEFNSVPNKGTKVTVSLKRQK